MTNDLMAKFDGVKGQELLDVEEQKDEVGMRVVENSGDAEKPYEAGG